MRYVLVLVLLVSLITPARAEWARWREKARGRSPHKEPRRRVERQASAARPSLVAASTTASAMAVRGRAQLTREMDRVTSSIRTILSPDRRHVAQLRSFPGGSVLFVDGRRAYPSTGYARIVGTPSWNPQGRSLALLEKVGRQLRLVVLPDVEMTTELLSWRIPPEPAGSTTYAMAGGVSAPAGDRVFWADNGRINIGRELLRPRAQVSFSVGMADAQGAE